ncbi:unnamed protein product [Dracunculus medinensis]|uniref:Calponin-homology (CH) domain-containing protein n=1 Tax=Dracunculus medinensis TaxID=318479 RepID=A0A3P7PH40_DRAME|nr:unnamed protein product [Dracunculus medinensis]
MKSWINFILNENHVYGSFPSDLRKAKIEADSHLRKMLHVASNMESTSNRSILKNSDKFKHFMIERHRNEIRIQIRSIYLESKIPQQIVSLVENNKLIIRLDKRVHSDIGLQTELLKLFFSFNTFWLRLGLETIFTEDLPSDKSDTLASFIFHRLFQDPSLMGNQKYVQGRNRTVITESGSKMLLQHFLTKLCQFLYIVGVARSVFFEMKIIPCLFKRESSYKSLSDVCAAISRLLISGSCNLPKILSRIGLDLDYRQGFFEEYCFVVNSLPSDLSDGIILGKVIEIIFGMKHNEIISCLRNPCGDRIRKINNVNIEKDCCIDSVSRRISLYSSLAKNPISFERFDLTKAKNLPEHISEYEQLFKLYKLIAERFGFEIHCFDHLTDGRLFRAIWQEYGPYKSEMNEYQESTMMEQIAHAAEEEFGIPASILLSEGMVNVAALPVFAHIFLIRIFEYNQITIAATKIQKAYRVYKQRKISGKTHQQSISLDEKCSRAATIIQVYYVTFFYWKAVPNSGPSVEPDEFWQEVAVEGGAAYFRSWVAHRRKAATVIQANFRSWLARRDFHAIQKKRIKAAIIIQVHFRSWLARRDFHIIKEKRIKAAIVIQAYFRSWLVRRHFHVMQEVRVKAAIIIQKQFRSWLAHRAFHDMQEKLRKAATTIQCFVMGNCPVNQRFSKNFVVLWYISFDIALKASAMEKNTVDSSHMARTLLQKQSALVHRNVRFFRGWFVRRNFVHFRENKITLKEHAFTPNKDIFDEKDLNELMNLWIRYQMLCLQRIDAISSFRRYFGYNL